MSTSDESKPAPAPKSASRILLVTWITVTNILALGSLLPWASLVLCSLMSNPSDEWSFSRISFLAAIYAYPFIIVGLVMYTRYAYKKGWDWTAQITSIVSIVPVLWFLLEISNGI